MPWPDDLRPASFRGVPFYVRRHTLGTGRRAVQHEYPERDTPYAEDMGRRGRRYRVTAYVIGDDYAAGRDALLAACERRGDAGTLVHPYLGTLLVRCGEIEMEENEDEGGQAVFGLEFLESGSGAPPGFGADTAGAALSALASAAKVLRQVYGQVRAIVAAPQILIAMAEQLAASVGAGLTGLPADTLADCIDFVAGLLEPDSTGTGLDGTPVQTLSDPAALADGVSAAFFGIAGAILAAGAPPIASDDPVLGQTPPPLLPGQDPTAGLGALAGWTPSPALPYAPAGSDAATRIAAQVAGFAGLARDAAVLAVAQVVAGTDFATADDAARARDTLTALMDARLEAAAAAGSDDLYRMWRAVSALVVLDLIARAQNLPRLAPYAVAAVLPAAALAQLLLQDGSEADDLATLNGVPHALFMPVGGAYVQPRTGSP